MSTKLMIFDKNPLELVGIKLLFDPNEIELKAETSLDAKKMKSMINEWNPHVILFDFNSCETCIDELTVALKRNSDKIKILWLLMEDNDFIKYDAISAGADGCVLKLNFDQISEAVKSVQSGDVFYSRKVLAQFAHEACLVVDHLGRKVNRLTDREKSVLRLIRQGLTNKEISKELFISIETVKAHIRKIRNTLGVLNRRQMICGIRPARNNIDRSDVNANESSVIN